MADTKTINTRIVLRNDTLANWNSSSKTLLKGEAALALLPDGKNYQLRIGTGDKTWSELEPSNVIIPAQNISGLTYAEYQLSNTTPDGETDFKFALMGLSAADNSWHKIGTDITVPEFDASGLEADIAYLSDQVSTLIETTLPELAQELSSTLSSYTDQEVGNLRDEVAAVSAETLLSAEDTAKKYTDSVSALLSTDYQSQINEIKSDILNGIHFIGHVADFGVTHEDPEDETSPVVSGWYKLTTEGEQIEAKAGDLIINAEKEYIWSNALMHWDEFGDEGNYATKQYVNDAKAAAISATQNAVYVEDDLTDAEVADYRQAEGDVNVIGDILINKKTIAEGETAKQYTAYVWNGTAWTAMDGNYSAENVIMPDDMTITYQFGKYTIPSTGSTVLTCAGMDLQSFLNDAFAETKSGTVTLPTFTFGAGGDRTAEIGTTYTLPAATLKMTGVGSYQYGPATGITVTAGSAEVSCTTAGFTTEKSNTDVMALNSTLATDAGTDSITYLSTAVTYNYGAHATYTQGAVPKNNIGGQDPDKQIASALCSLTCSAKFTGVYPAYYGFTTLSKANPTAIVANNGNVTIDGVTYTRELNSFNKTSFTTSSKWYELFYMIPKGKHTSWSGKDSNNVDLAIDAKSEATITFLDGSTATYEVFVVRNAAQYSATTCTMKWA